MRRYGDACAAIARMLPVMSQWNPPPPEGGDGNGAPTDPPQAPPPPGAYGQPPTLPDVPAQPGTYGQPPAPQQYGTPQYGAPPPGAYGQPPAPQQYGTPQYGGYQYGGYQPPAAPYQYGTGLPTTAVLASPGRRIGGYLIDVVILVVVSIPVWLLAAVLLGTTSTQTSTFDGTNTTTLDGVGLGGFFLLLIGISVIQVLYHVAFVAVKGQTPGAMLVKVRVVRLSDGEIPGWGPAIMRWVPNLVGFVPCVGSLLTIALWIWALVNLFANERRQTPFDLAAKTVVVAA